MKIRLRKPDQMFSKYLRKKIGRCEYYHCGNRTLQVSHFWGRRHESVRYSEENCDIFCFAHHQNFEENPADYTEWKKQKLGEKRYKKLEVSKNTYCKRDDKMMEIALKNL